MKRELLSYLCCPNCSKELELYVEGSKEDEIITGSLQCTRCMLIYPILHAIPRFVSPSVSSAVRRTTKNFGDQWHRFDAAVANTQFASVELFVDFIKPVTSEYFFGKCVLDVGCGLGRFSMLAHEFGSATVVGMDLSNSVTVAYENTRRLPNVHIIQADIMWAPFRKESFDYAFSVGVLHHTSNPSKAFASVVATVRPGGGVSAWVYGRENNEWILKWVNPIREHITSRLPNLVLHCLAQAIGGILWLVTKVLYSRGWSWLPYGEYMQFLRQFGYRELTLIANDHLIPELAEYISRPEFESWFTGNRLQDVVISSRTGNSWRGFGELPIR